LASPQNKRGSTHDDRPSKSLQIIRIKNRSVQSKKYVKNSSTKEKKNVAFKTQVKSTNIPLFQQQAQ
jgi:hypothetical protein